MLGKLICVMGVSAITAFVACSSSDQGGCTKDSDCKDARLCVAGACVDSDGGSSSASDSGGAGGAGSCGWHGNCSSKAPNGAYDCSGDLLMQCVNGSWVSVVACGSTQDSKGYSCTCKGGCGMNTTECSYAFSTCEGNSYPTCGPNAKPVLTSSWVCE